MEEETNSELFETDVDAFGNETGPLVDEPYTYENIVNNPVIKPIAETDRSIRDLDEMIFKKLTDMKRDKNYINSAIDDVPAYQDSPFIAKLIKLAQNADDIIKLQDIRNNNLTGCIKEMIQIIRERYGVRGLTSKEDEYVEPETKIPEGSYKSYLEKLTQHKDKNIASMSIKIFQIFIEDKVSKDDKIKFENACSQVYKDEIEKSMKRIVNKILRMEL